MKLKYVPAIFWAICILIATNNHNFAALLFDQEIKFNVVLFPNPYDLFITYDIYLNSKVYVLQKIGHVISFGVLFILLNRSMADHKKAFILCSIFAFLTEFMQLFFERDGRLFDVLIDLTGIYLASRLLIYKERVQ